MYKKSALHAQVAFLLITPIVVFSPLSLPSPLSITRLPTFDEFKVARLDFLGLIPPKFEH